MSLGTGQQLQEHRASSHGKASWDVAWQVCLKKIGRTSSLFVLRLQNDAKASSLFALHVSASAYQAMARHHGMWPGRSCFIKRRSWPKASSLFVLHVNRCPAYASIEFCVVFLRKLSLNLCLLVRCWSSGASRAQRFP